MLYGEHFSVVIDGHRLVDIESLQLAPGEVMAVVGPNGAGKTTALRVFSGELLPATGQVVMNGIPLGDWPVRTRALVRAVLPQSSSLGFSFRVDDVVLMGRAPHNGNAAEDRAVIDHAMQLADISHLAGRSYTDLSGGEQQRVHLARVLAQLWSPDESDAKYLLLDEPTSALDLAHQHQTLSIVRSFAQQHKVGVLVILHDLNLASLYADRLVMLKQGRVFAAGKPADVLDAATVEAVFDCPVTIIEHPDNPACPMVVAAQFHDRAEDLASG